MMNGDHSQALKGINFVFKIGFMYLQDASIHQKVRILARSKQITIWRQICFKLPNELLFFLCNYFKGLLLLFVSVFFLLHLAFKLTLFFNLLRKRFKSIFFLIFKIKFYLFQLLDILFILILLFNLFKPIKVLWILIAYKMSFMS